MEVEKKGILPISKISSSDKENFKINMDVDLTVNQINIENRKIVLNYTPEDENSDNSKTDEETSELSDEEKAVS